MFSELVQFKVTKSHNHHPRVPSLKCYDAKFSLQLEKSIQKLKGQQNNCFMPIKQIDKNHKIYIRNITRNIEPKRNEKKTQRNFQNHDEYEYFYRQENPYNFYNDSRTKIPLIVSPNKLAFIKQQTSFGRQTPLISSLNHRESMRENKNKKNLLNTFENGDQKENSIISTVEINKSLQSSLNKCNNNHLFRRSTQESFSPIRHKLSSIKQNSNFQNSLMKESTSTKRFFNRSDSFKAAIEKTHSIRKALKQNLPPNEQKNNKDFQKLNNQYYSENHQNTHELQSSKNYRFKQKVIKNPIQRKINIVETQKLKTKSSYSTINNKTQEMESHQQANLLYEKEDFLIQQLVNNSNIFVLGESDEKLINMDPY